MLQSYIKEFHEIIDLGESYPKEAIQKLSIWAVRFENDLEEGHFPDSYQAKLILEAIDGFRKRVSSSDNEIAKNQFRLFNDLINNRDYQDSLDDLEVSQLIYDTFKQEK